jgi:N-acetylmuramoyl-L-alanine amidase
MTVATDLPAPTSTATVAQVSTAAPIITNSRALPPAPPKQPVETWVPVTRWSSVNGLSGPTILSLSPTPVFTIRSPNGVLMLRAGSRLAHWNGLEVHLGFPPQWIDRQPYVHALDVRATIQPLLKSSLGINVSGSPILVVDAGHGGENAGTRSVLANRYEKEFTLDWARRLQELLRTNGWQVFLTRTNDTDLALSNRVAFAESHRADIFVSLHFNSAAPNESEAGLETYCLTPAGMPSSVTRGYEDSAGQLFPNNNFDAQNLLLAMRIHEALLEVNGHRDRGVRHARFPGVLRNQQRAAVLVEGGYLSNPKEARLIADPAYRQKLAEAIAKALAGCVRNET